LVFTLCEPSQPARRFFRFPLNLSARLRSVWARFRCFLVVSFVLVLVRPSLWLLLLSFVSFVLFFSPESYFLLPPPFFDLYLGFYKQNDDVTIRIPPIFAGSSLSVRPSPPPPPYTQLTLTPSPFGAFAICVIFLSERSSPPFFPAPIEYEGFQQIPSLPFPLESLFFVEMEALIFAFPNPP